MREGRTNAWIAHQLEVSVKDIDAFKREHGLVPDGANGDAEPAPAPDEMNLRAEDDALVAAALDAEPEEEPDEEEVEQTADDEAPKPRRSRRGRRGGRGRRAGASGPLEGTFDHGEEGYGLWLDPAVEDNPVYAEHWAGHRPVTVSIEEDRIVIRRAGDDDEDEDDD